MERVTRLSRPARIALERRAMHLAGQTESDLAAWAHGRGAAPGAARTLARALVASFARRPSIFWVRVV